MAIDKPKKGFGVDLSETLTCPECGRCAPMKITTAPCGCHRWFVYADCDCGHCWCIREGYHCGSEKWERNYSLNAEGGVPSERNDSVLQT